MSQETLAARIARAPRPYDPAMAADVAARFAAHPEAVRALLAGTAGCSTFLAGLISREADWLEAALGQPPEATFAITAKEVTAREYCTLHGQWAAQG